MMDDAQQIAAGRNPSPAFGFHGPRIITNPLMTEPCEDFSQSRSPSRALRRWKQRGIRGRGIFERPSRKLIHLRADNTIVCHPVMYAEIRAILQATDQ